MAEQTPQAPAKPAANAVQVSPSLVKPVAPAAPVEPAAVVPQAAQPSEAEQLKAQLDARAKEIDKRHARTAKEARELAEQRKALDTDRKEFEDWKKLREDRRRNPDKYLKADFGEDYYDKLTKLKVDGAPPADLIASEMDERMAKLQAQLDEKSKALDERLNQAQAQEARRAKEQYLASAKEHVKSNADKYKLIHRFEEFDSVAGEIERHFRATCKKDMDGNWLPGETLTAEQAADAIEKRIKDIAEKFRGYFEEEQKTKAPQPVATKRPEPTQRREQEDAPITDADRWRRAMAVGEREMASRQH